MSTPNNGNDSPGNDQTTPEQGSTNQLQTIITLLTTMQQNANDDRTAMRHFRDTVTSRLANPFGPIESVVFNLRAPSDGPADSSRGFYVSVHPPIDGNSPGGLELQWEQWLDVISPETRSQFYTFVRRRNETTTSIISHMPGSLEPAWESWLGGMPPDVQDRFRTFIGPRIAAIANATTQMPGARAASAPSQDVDQNRSRDSDNAELQELRQSALEQTNRIKELEDALTNSQAHQSRTTTTDPQKSARGPHGAQEENESDEAEASGTAQRRAAQSNAAPGPLTGPPAGLESDAEMAKKYQEQGISQAELREMIADRAMPRDRNSNGDNSSTQESDDEAVKGNKKRDKGKGRARDAAKEDDSSQDAPTESRTPPSAGSSSDDDAPPDDTEPAHTGKAATKVEQPRRKSQRKINIAQREADEAEKSKIKLENHKEPRRKPWINPKTGKPVRGWDVVESGSEKEASEEEAASPPDSKPGKKTNRNAQTSATNKRQSGTRTRAEQTTDNTETQASMGLRDDDTGDDDVQNQEMSQQLKRLSEVEETDPADNLNEIIGSDNGSSDAPLLDAQFDEYFSDDPISEPTDEDEDEDQDESDDGEGNGKKNGHRPARSGEKRKANSSRPGAESNEEEEEEEEDIGPSRKKKQKLNNTKPDPAAKSKQEEVDGPRRKTGLRLKEYLFGHLPSKK